MGKIIFLLLLLCPAMASATLLVEDEGLDAEQRWLRGSLAPEKEPDYSFQAVIPKGTVLEHLGTHEQVVVPDSIIAWVVVLADEPDKALILTKTKDPLYKTSSLALSPVSGITDLGPTPKSQETYRPTDPEVLDDKRWKLTTAANIHLESPDPALYADSTGLEVQTATAIRYEIAALFGKLSSLNFGPAFSYRTGVFRFADIDLEKGRFESYSLGVVIDYPVYLGELVAIKARLSGMSSPVYRIREYAGQRSSLEFSNREIQGAVEMAYHWIGPDLVFGLFLQKQWTVLETKNRPAGPSPTPSSPMFGGLYLGLKTTFDI